MSEPSPTHTPTDPQATGLDIAAIVCAVLVAPVGVVLGILARSAAKREGHRPHALATASIIVGSIVTGLTVVATVIPLIVFASVASTVASSAEKSAQCAQLGSSIGALQSFTALEVPRQDDAAGWKSLAAETDQMLDLAKSLQQPGVYPDDVIADASNFWQATAPLASDLQGQTGGWWAAAKSDLFGSQSGAQELLSNIGKICPAS